MNASHNLHVSAGGSTQSKGFRKPALTTATTAKIIFVEEPAGKGKTKALAEAICKLKEAGERVLVILPTRALMAQYAVYNPDWLYLYSGDDKKGVAESIIEAVCCYEPVIVVTQEGMERAARKIGVDEHFTEAIKDYGAFLDEVPAAKHSVAQLIPYGKEHIAADWLPYMKPVSDAEANILECQRPDILQDMLNAKRHSTEFGKFLFHLVSGQLVQMTGTKSGMLYSAVGDKATFRLLGVCKSVMLLGAAVEKMTFVQRAKEIFGHGLTVEQNTNLIPPVKSYPNPERCEFITMTRGKASFTRDAKHFTEICERALSAIPKDANGNPEPFVYVTNDDKQAADFKTVADAVFKPAGGVRMPFKTHGLNDFAGINVHKGKLSMCTTDPKESGSKVLLTSAQYEKGFAHCIFLGVANIRPSDARWLSPEMQEATKIENGSETCFQALTRTSLRDFTDSTTKHTFVVMCEDYASYCTERYLKGAVVDGSVMLVHADKYTERREQAATGFIEAVTQLQEAGKKVTAKAVLSLVGDSLTLKKVQLLLTKWKRSEMELEQLLA